MTTEYNLRFRRISEESGLPFSAHAQFRKDNLDAWQNLYRRLAEQIWNPERLAQEEAS